MNTRLLTAAMLSAPLVCMAASFDCAKARTHVEVLICSDANLSRQDERLSEAYRSALAGSANPGAVTQWQRDWLKSARLAGCKDSACVSKEYTSRIQVLEQVSVEERGVRWTGQYSRVVAGKDDRSAQLTIVQLVGRRIFISGTAYWQGASPGQVNTGEIDGIGSTSDAQANFDMDGCKGQLAIRNERLIVESESGCGGLNVSFVGEYKRR
jgi:uncharacterized protein